MGHSRKTAETASSQRQVTPTGAGPETVQEDIDLHSYKRNADAILRRPAFSWLVAPDVVHAREFVNCDGTDESVGLQKFFDALSGKRGVLPSGEIRYATTPVIAPTASFKLEGVGYNPNASSCSVLRNIGAGHALNASDVSGLGVDLHREFDNFTICGHAGSQNGLHLDYLPGFLVNRIWSTSHGWNGLYGRRVFSSKIKDSTFTGNGRDGGQLVEQINAMNIDHCAFNGNSRTNGYAGLRINGGAGLECQGIQIHGGCDFTGNAFNAYTGTNADGYGLILTGVWSAMVIGNYAEAGKSELLYVGPTSRAVIIEGNYFQDGRVTVEDGAKFCRVGYNTFHYQTIATSFRGLSSQATNKNTYSSQHLVNGATESVAA